MVVKQNCAPARRRCLVLILDGLGDCPATALNGSTPLEAARTPNLDRLAANGRYGLVDPIARGVTPNTHSGVGTMFGLHPDQRGLLHRGPVEAAGAGLKLRSGDIAFRANLATLEERDGRLWVEDRRAGRVTNDSAAFAEMLREIDLGDGVTGSFRPTDQHRGALVLSGPGLGADLGDTDPGDQRAPGWLRPCRALQVGSAFTAEKVDRFILAAHERLNGHPLNGERSARGKLPVTGVITRGAGAWFELDPILAGEGIAASLVAGCNTVIGLGKLFGMTTIREPGFTADARTDVRAKLLAARAALEDVPLAFVHIKAPDLFAHDFQPEGKRDFIERVDSALAILDGSGWAIALTADHTTDSNTGAHTADPVPALFYTPEERGQSSSATLSPGLLNFGEAACRTGNMPRRDGHELLLDIVDWLKTPG